MAKLHEIAQKFRLAADTIDDLVGLLQTPVENDKTVKIRKAAKILRKHHKRRRSDKARTNMSRAQKRSWRKRRQEERQKILRSQKTSRAMKLSWARRKKLRLAKAVNE